MKLLMLLKVLLMVSIVTHAVAAEKDAKVATADHADQQVVALNSDPALSDRLLNALDQMGEAYVPRTEHLRPDGSPVYVNRLILEDSPYLIQHAHNPVNWYPWGEEAFTLAQRQDKPVFLSIGYATCHWCHVMERESFENEEIAALLNDDYIAIKVDREQLPDVDALFMTAVMMINGSGGWPMSSFLDSAGRPFFGGTYFQPDHFSQLLTRIDELWSTERAVLMEQADQLSSAMHRANQLEGEAVAVGEQELDRALLSALERFDSKHGGFGGAPKFPQENILHFLLEQARRTGNYAALNAADVTLKSMAAGGIHDQIGGGFHRYSVDDRWLVPHFEKMLYNQAALARNYSKAYLLTGDREHERIARNILDYVLREMVSSEGMFYSATDADSLNDLGELAEGSFFTWSPEELTKALGKDDAQLAIAVWGVTDAGNFDGATILHRTQSFSELAQLFDLSEQQLHDRLAQISETLRAVRQQRNPPLLDNKVITEWNAMMITALAEASDALDEPRYIDAARTAANQLWQTARPSPGKLWRSRYAGRSAIAATQIDYANLAEAYITMYDIDGDQRWLQHAQEITDAMIDRFWDQEQGGFFMGEQVVAGAALVTRPKDLHDSSTPSGNSVALRALVRLHGRTGEFRYREQADELIASISPQIAQYNGGFYYLLSALGDHVLGESGARQFAANGKVKATASRVDDNRVSVTLDIAPGWHINADKPLQDYLIATRLTGANDQALSDTRYPQPVQRKLRFQSDALALFEESVVVSGKLPEAQPADSTQSVQLQLQACSDEICLAPETLVLSLDKI